MKVEFTDEEINWLYEAMHCNFALVDTSNPDRWNDTIPETIKNKLIATFKLTNLNFKDKYIEHNLWDNNHLFLGGGVYSANDVARCHKRLAYAVMMLGGLQQPGHPETKEEAEQEDIYLFEGEQKIKAALKDIIAAFGYAPEDLND